MPSQISRRYALRLVLGAGTSGILAACSTFVPDGSTSISQFSTRSALAKINQTRSAHGIASVSLNSKLTQAAQQQVRRMGAAGELSHTLGGTIRERVRDVSYVGAVGEVIAGGHNTFEKAITGWLNSSSHRGVMLSAKFTEVGIAAGNGRAPYNTYWVAIFGGDTNAWLTGR